MASGSGEHFSSAIGNMIFQGVGRQKTGVLKEHNLIEIYKGGDVSPGGAFGRTTREDDDKTEHAF